MPQQIKADSELAQAVGIERRYGVVAKWALLLSSALALWVWRGPGIRAGEDGRPYAFLLIAYACATLALGIVFYYSSITPARTTRPILRSRASEGAWRAWLLASSCLDQVYVAVIIGLTGGIHSDFYLAFGFMALKGAVYYPSLKQMIYVSFSSFFLWVAACYAATYTLHFLLDYTFLGRYFALFFWTLACLVVGRLVARRQQSIITLDASLSRQSEALENQARVVEQTAKELANRLLEVRSLQESVRAINSALDLDELLQSIVENATQVVRGARCTIALVDPRRNLVITSAAAGVPREQLWGTAFRIGEGVAGWVVENRKPALIDSVAGDPRFKRVGNRAIASMLSVPLYSGEGGPDSTEGEVVGALTATSAEPGAFSEADVSLLDAFGDQAAIAVKNSRLYEQLVREEHETGRLYQSVLEKSDELEAVLRGIGDAVIVTDTNARLLMMNPVAARILQVLETPSPGVRLPDIVSHKGLLTLLDDALAEVGAPLMREINLSSGMESSLGDGIRERIYQALASSVRGANGHARGVVIVMRDITSQKEVDQIKSDFLSVVSHELRTPLHSIKGFVEIILMGKTGTINDLQRDFLSTVQESTTNLQRLIDDLLEFSRMEAGQVKLRPEQMSLYDVAETVLDRLRPLGDEKSLGLVNDIPEELASIEADPMRIEQVLTNLASNAIKFTPEGGTITIAGEDRSTQVLVAVTDTGIGIPEEEQPLVFQRFYQVDGSATRAYRGAGLGLTISKFIVEYHHGRIWVESVEGEGTTFSFVLPKELPKDEELVIDFTRPARPVR